MRLKQSKPKKESLWARMTKTERWLYFVAVGIFFIEPILLVIFHVMKNKKVLESRSVEEFLAAGEPFKFLLWIALSCLVISVLLIFAIVCRVLLRRSQ
jgi:heme exporter protein D